MTPSATTIETAGGIPAVFVDGERRGVSPTWRPGHTSGLRPDARRGQEAALGRGRDRFVVTLILARQRKHRQLRLNGPAAELDGVNGASAPV